jgi:uncharacterized membrane protein
VTVNTDVRRELELAIARLLNVGTLTSVILLAIGVVLMIVRGQSPLAGDAPGLDLGRIPADIAALRPEGFLWLGLIAVIATPTSRVIASLVGFASAGEREMALISVGVLAIIATGVALSIGASG